MITPYVYDDVEDVRVGFPFPDATQIDIDPDWEPVEAPDWFVDATGFGSPGEPALTPDQFVSELRNYVREYSTHGFAIVGVGQFQVYVRAYRPTNK